MSRVKKCGWKFGDSSQQTGGAQNEKTHQVVWSFKIQGWKNDTAGGLRTDRELIKRLQTGKFRRKKKIEEIQKHGDELHLLMLCW